MILTKNTREINSDYLSNLTKTIIKLLYAYHRYTVIIIIIIISSD